MTTIRQLIQSSPARANELFAKLIDTSESAVKTREKLFSELKDELELLASLEEQHLFPVLRKHKDLKDLVREALNDNKATRKLLTELDHTPKDTEEFGARVAELRRVFQQHVRDDKKDLLPAILKALSDEEAEVVIEGFEAGKAEIEEAKQAEAEERRAAARREREEAERVQQAAESVVQAAWAAPQAAEHAAAVAQEAVQTSLNTTSQAVKGATDQVTEMLGAVRQRNQDLTERASKNLESLVQSGASLSREMQDVSGEYLEMVQERLQRNLDGVNKLARCRSLPQLIETQGALFRENLELTLSNGRRLAEASARLADSSTRTLTAQTGQDTKRAA